MEDDKELEAALDGLETEPTPEADDSAAGSPSNASERVEPTQAEKETAGKAGNSEEIEVEGRKYPNLEAFKRAHAHLYRDHSRVTNRLTELQKRHEPFSALEKAWTEDPKFFDHLMKAKEEYFARRKAGESPAEAKRNTGLDQVPKEVLERLSRHDQVLARVEQREADQELDAEMSDIRKKFNLDDAMVDRVCEKALDVAQKTGFKISLEEAYERLQVIENRGKSLRAEAELKRVKGNAAPGSGSVNQPPAPKKGIGDYASSSDEDKALDEILDSIGK